MKITKDEKAMLEGRDGEAVKLAMEILTEVGEAFGAEELVDASSAHIVLAMYKSIYDAGVEVCEKFAAMGGKFKVTTTLDPCGMDTERPDYFKTPREYQDKQNRVGEAYRKMGAIPVWTCTPHFAGNLPRFGEHVGWTESSAVAFINSALGARSNRETAGIDVCIGLTGKTPKYGLHLDENRRAQALLRLELGGRKLERWEYPVLGYFLGKTLGSEVGVLDGMAGLPGNDDLKAMLAGAAASGPLALLHVAGVTPEAPTVEKALGGNKPGRTVVIDQSVMDQCYAELSTAGRDRKVDLVAVGCPHYSVGEIERVLALMKGRRVAKGVEFWIYANRPTVEMAERMGLRRELSELGVTVTLETCMLISPIDAWNFKTLMTDSSKCAFYAPIQVRCDVLFGSIEDCVERAISG